MYVVLEGRVMISKYIPGAGEEALAFLERGDYFGEMALIDNQPRSADAKAHDGGAVVLAIPRDVLNRHPGHQQALFAAPAQDPLHPGRDPPARARRQDHRLVHPRRRAAGRMRAAPAPAATSASASPRPPPVRAPPAPCPPGKRAEAGRVPAASNQPASVPSWTTPPDWTSAAVDVAPRCRGR